MPDCLCKYFHSEVAEVYVSRWQSSFLWHSKTFQLWILFLFSAREQPIALMNHQIVILVNFLLQSNVFTSLIRISETFRRSVFISTETHSVIKTLLVRCCFINPVFELKAKEIRRQPFVFYESVQRVQFTSGWPC